MNPNILQTNKKSWQVQSACLILTIILSLLSIDMTYAWQSDTRIPAGDHTLSAELAPAIGRLRKGNHRCTGWIAQGGVLITAAHCHTDWDGGLEGAIFEFNVPLSDANGTINSSDPKDQYIVSDVIHIDDYRKPKLQGGGGQNLERIGLFLKFMIMK